MVVELTTDQLLSAANDKNNVLKSGFIDGSKITPLKPTAVTV